MKMLFIGGSKDKQLINIPSNMIRCEICIPELPKVQIQTDPYSVYFKKALEIREVYERSWVIEDAMILVETYVI